MNYLSFTPRFDLWQVLVRCLPDFEVRDGVRRTGSSRGGTGNDGVGDGGTDVPETDRCFVKEGETDGVGVSAGPSSVTVAYTGNMSTPFTPTLSRSLIRRAVSGGPKFRDGMVDD